MQRPSGPTRLRHACHAAAEIWSRFPGPPWSRKTEAASFRSLTAMSARERDAALSAGALAYLFSDWVAQRFNLPKPALPDSSFEANPEAAAHAVRQQWGLGQQPVSDMVKLLESKGARVFSLSENTKNVDAFSCWRDSTPYVFLNTFKSYVRTWVTTV